jgi:hypothetical protein
MCLIKHRGNKHKEGNKLGDYIRRGTDEIKIGNGQGMLFYTREEILKFKEEGYRGFYADKYNNEIDLFLKDDETFYMYTDSIHQKDVEHLLFNVEADSLKHKKVTLYHEGYKFSVECAESGNKVISSRLIGEIYVNGQLESILKCNCCGAMFSFDHIESMFFRRVLPNLKQLINSSDDKGCNEDLSLIEILELMVTKYSLENFMHIVSSQHWINEKVLKELKANDFNSASRFYNETTEKLKRVANI